MLHVVKEIMEIHVFFIPVLRLILFDHPTIYAIKKMDRVVREEIPGSHIRFRCPLCHEGYGSLWYPLVQYQYKGFFLISDSAVAKAIYLISVPVPVQFSSV